MSSCLSVQGPRDTFAAREVEEREELKKRWEVKQAKKLQQEELTMSQEDRGQDSASLHVMDWSLSDIAHD